MRFMPGSRAVAAGHLLALCGAAPAAATITPISGSIFLSAWSQTGSSGQIYAASPLLRWKGEADLLVAEQADSPPRSKEVTVINHASLDARWDNAASGRVEITSDWTIAPGFGSTNPKKDLTAAAAYYETRWDYRTEFSTGTSLTFSYGLSGTGDLANLSEWELDLIGPDGFQVLLDSTAGLGASGVFTTHFGPGQYRFELFSSGSSPTATKAISGHTDARFGWALQEDAAAPFPEPASWTMLLSGFGAVGAALRSRRNSASSLA